MKHIFRMIDLQDSVSNDGVLVDMEYEIVDGEEKVVDIYIHNIINNIVGEEVDVSPVIKLAFAANILQILKQQREQE